jgi:hypothetical protein
MNRIKLFVVLAVVGLLFATAPVKATLWTSNIYLDGLQEVGPVATTGTGSATVTFDDLSGAMNVTGLFQNLIGTANNAHVHGYAGPGVNAGVVFGLTWTANTSGTITGAGVIPAPRIPDVLNGLTYINVHSTFRPGGEIRGQITDFRVPEPSTIALAVGAIVGVVAFRHRNR